MECNTKPDIVPIPRRRLGGNKIATPKEHIMLKRTLFAFALAAAGAYATAAPSKPECIAPAKPGGRYFPFSSRNTRADLLPKVDSTFKTEG